MFVSNAKDLLKKCNEKGISIYEYTILYEIERSGLNRKEVINKMCDIYNTMITCTDEARYKEVFGVSGISGGNAFKYKNYIDNNKSIAGDFISTAVNMAISASEVNASMGQVVACPTAGSCGILPAAVNACKEIKNISEDKLIEALFTSSGVGIIIGEHATFSGAEGGCQAECGSASAMTAAMIVELMGGTPEMALHAAAISLKCVLGLICDPVAGLVEIPCVKRNAMGVSNAIVSADLALAGVPSYIPFDDVVETMFRVGNMLPCEHRETAKGGLAITKVGEEIKNKVFGI